MKKRILFIDEDQERNGSTVSMEYLVRGFHARGYDVLVLTWKTDARSKAGLTPWATMLDARWGVFTTITMCVHFAYTMPPWSLRGFTSIVKDLVKFVVGFAIVRKAIKTYRPDLVYVNEYSVVQASVAAAVSGVPAVVHIRSQMLEGVLGVRRRLVAGLVLKCNEAVFAITRFEAEQMHPRPSERAKVCVVGEFVPPPPSGVSDAAVLRNGFGLPAGRPVVAMLGGIKDIKGTIDFLLAAGEIVRTRPDVVFAVAGGDYREGSPAHRGYYDRCMREVELLRRSGSICMLGEIPNPLDLITASDIIVSPSTATHFSRPVVEAWRLGKPVIAASTAHMRDLITHESNALLVDAGDPGGLARAIIRLLEDHPLCRRLAEMGKEKAEAEFDAETNLRIIVDRCDTHVRARS
jgi:glycosyltransferase involved in cell wall biosynthesis